MLQEVGVAVGGRQLSAAVEWEWHYWQPTAVIDSLCLAGNSCQIDILIFVAKYYLQWVKYLWSFMKRCGVGGINAWYLGSGLQRWLQYVLRIDQSLSDRAGQGKTKQPLFYTRTRDEWPGRGDKRRTTVSWPGVQSNKKVIYHLQEKNWLTWVWPRKIRRGAIQG